MSLLFCGTLWCLRSLPCRDTGKFVGVEDRARYFVYLAIILFILANIDEFAKISSSDHILNISYELNSFIWLLASWPTGFFPWKMNLIWHYNSRILFQYSWDGYHYGIGWAITQTSDATSAVQWTSLGTGFLCMLPFSVFLLFSKNIILLLKCSFTSENVLFLYWYFSVHFPKRLDVQSDVSTPSIRLDALALCFFFCSCSAMSAVVSFLAKRSSCHGLSLQL